MVPRHGWSLAPGRTESPAEDRTQHSTPGFSLVVPARCRLQDDRNTWRRAAAARLREGRAAPAAVTSGSGLPAPRQVQLRSPHGAQRQLGLGGPPAEARQRQIHPPRLGRDEPTSRGAKGGCRQGPWLSQDARRTWAGGLKAAGRLDLRSRA